MSLKLADLKNALADKNKLSSDLATANERISQLEQQLSESQGSSQAQKERADGLQHQIDEANKTIEQLSGKVTTLEAQKKTISQATVEKLHELGVPASELPKNTLASQESDESIYKQWKALNGAEKTEYFRKNIQALERYAASQES